MKNRTTGYYLTTLFAFLIFTFTIKGQSKEYLQTIDWLKEKKIAINDPLPPAGFQKYRDCESNPVFKKVSGDTIIFYVLESAMAQRFEYLNSVAQRPYFNNIVYPQMVQKDGSVIIAHMVPKIFLLKNDFLFIIDNSEGEAFKMKDLVQNMDRLVKKISIAFSRIFMDLPAM